MTVDKAIQDEARRAIDPYLASVTYPIIWSNGDRIATLGTSVLFKYGARHFLLTARHLFDEYDKTQTDQFPYEGLVGPVGREKVAPSELGNIFVHDTTGGNAAFLDVVAIELMEKAFVRSITGLWSFITVQNFANPSPDTGYFVSGFPKERERQIGENVGASLMSLLTHQADDVPDDADAPDERFDLFLKYYKETFDFYDHNKSIQSPWVGGVSGGPVFRVADERPTIWAPQNGLRYIGLQSSSTRANNWLRVKTVHAIAAYFNKAIPEIGAAISKHLAG